jgi:RimJ/RimL family protein N-acetyltransferase
MACRPSSFTDHLWGEPSPSLTDAAALLVGVVARRAGTGVPYGGVVTVERIELGDVVLRRPTPDDAVALHTVEADPAVWQLSPDLRPTDLEQTRQRLAGVLEHWQEHGFGYWIVEVDGRVVGSGGIRTFDMQGEWMLNVYYRLAPEVQGRGIASSIVQAALDLARHVQPGVPLVVRTDPRNVAARRVAEKADFQPAGMESSVERPLQVLRRSST